VSTAAPVSDNLRGAGLMMLSMAAFTFNDTAIKALGDAIPLAQAIFLRGLMTTVLLYAAGRMMGVIRHDLPRRDWALIVLRSLAELGATFLFLTALMNMPLANITAILQALPLTVAVGAALVFGEPLGWRRIVAIAIGFFGVMLIIRPGPEGFTVYSLYALGAVGCVTIRDLASRRLSRATPSITVALTAAALIMSASGIITLMQGWAPVTGREFGLLGIAALFILAGYLASVMTMRVGEIGFVAPFRYTGLLWALLLGWLVFGHWPGPVTLLGACLVVATGLFTLYRERHLRHGPD